MTKVYQYNYYDAELLSCKVLTFVEFEILFKCSILNEHARNLLLDHIPEFFGPQQNMPTNEAFISTLTLVDILIFTHVDSSNYYLFWSMN